MNNLYTQYLIFILLIISVILYLRLRDYYLKEESTTYIEEQSQSHRQYIPVYFMLEKNKKIDTINTIVYLKQHYMIYKNTVIDLYHINEMYLDLKISITSKKQLIFNIIIDIVNDAESYHFIVINKDDFIDIIDYLKKYHIPMIDHHNIEKSYRDFPIYSKRQAYYCQNYKKKLEREMIL